MWEINATDQIFTLLLSIGSGVLFSLVYDIFKAYRLTAHKGTWAVFSEDVVFSLICTFLTFCLLMLRTKGQLRMFVFLGEGAGFFAARWLLSPYTVRFLRCIFRFFSALYKKVVTFLSVTAEKSFAFFIKIFKKFHKTIKKGLKRAKVMLYNYYAK